MNKLLVLFTCFNRCNASINANCVLIPKDVFIATPNMNSVYRHSLGDFDYGNTIRKNIYKIHCTNFFVGKCCRSEIKNTWEDTNLSFFNRLKLKESVKGMSFKESFHYFRKNFGIVYAIVASLKIFIKIWRKR